GLRAAPFEQIKAFFPQIIAQQMATPGGAFGLQASELLASGDKREGLPSAEEVASWTNDQLASSVRHSLSTGPINVVMVGDVTVDDAIAAVASTFGALPARGPALTPPPGSESRRYPAGGGDIVQLHHSGPAEQALAY